MQKPGSKRGNNVLWKLKRDQQGSSAESREVGGKTEGRQGRWEAG